MTLPQTPSSVYNLYMNRRLLSAVLLVLLLCSMVLVVRVTLARRDAGIYEQLELLADVRHEIVYGFVEETDESELVEAAVRGMIDSLNDPYTAFLTPEENDSFDKHVHGTFSGIGAMVDLDAEEERQEERRLRIVSPLEESPAWKAGVMAGDIVIEIDGKDTKGMRITECVERLTGPVDTDVTIKVRHPSDDLEQITITRAQINIQTVKGFRRDADQRWIVMLDPKNRIGYVRITQFTDRTVDDLRDVLEQFRNANARGLILDLRFNAGGLLSAAVAVSDMFLERGKPIVSVKGRTIAEKEYKSRTDPVVPNIPLVVLANEVSASAAEIVTGALADNGRARFIGMRTYGKGSVQHYKLLLDNKQEMQGGMKITNAYYYLPSGRNIHRREDKDVWGVDPEDGYFVPMTNDQIKKMMEIRREGEIIKQRQEDGTAPVVTAQWIEDELSDHQLAAAMRAMLGRLETNQWPVVGESGAELLIRRAKRASLTRRRDLVREHLKELEKELAELDANKKGGGEGEGEPVADAEGAVFPPESVDDQPIKSAVPTTANRPADASPDALAPRSDPTSTPTTTPAEP